MKTIFALNKLCLKNVRKKIIRNLKILLIIKRNVNKATLIKENDYK